MATVVVLPEPCKPTSITTVGGFGASSSRAFWPPISAVNSSCTILTTCCAGVRLAITSWPVARWRTTLTKLRTTLKFTSASRRASRTSRSA